MSKETKVTIEVKATAMTLKGFLKIVKRDERDIAKRLNGAEALEAVKSDGDALRYVKDQTPEVCLEAVKSDGDALQYVDTSVFSDDAEET